MLLVPDDPRPNSPEPQNAEGFSAALLGWYDRCHRDLPWRVPPADGAAGVRADPYRVWLSEIMLQQTTVAATIAYFEKFTALWPDIKSLAAAPDDDVMRAWAGLGYYSRARNLKAAAAMVAYQFGGQFPDSEDALRALPGVGAYTAAAIAAIAFGTRTAVVDGNVERVAARQLALGMPAKAAKNQIRDIVLGWTPADRPGDYAQAMMDLGATVCRPKNPVCPSCPVSAGCAAFRQGRQADFPVRARKPERPLRRGAAFVMVRADGAVLLRKRPAKGLLGGMSEPPGSAWGENPEQTPPFGLSFAPAGSIRHEFTHFRLELAVFRHDTPGFAAPDGHWWAIDPLREALPNVFAKAITRALAADPEVLP